jgi:hypothetical protein
MMTQSLLKTEKVVIIKAMMTESLLKTRESGHHKGDDDQTPSQNQKKWSS